MPELCAYWAGLAAHREGRHDAATRLLLTAFTSPCPSLSAKAGAALTRLYGVAVA